MKPPELCRLASHFPLALFHSRCGLVHILLLSPTSTVQFDSVKYPLHEINGAKGATVNNCGSFVPAEHHSRTVV